MLTTRHLLAVDGDKPEPGCRPSAGQAQRGPGLDLPLRRAGSSRLVREGLDIVLVAELMGHARLETIRAYSLPTDADREAAINSLLTDH